MITVSLGTERSTGFIGLRLARMWRVVIWTWGMGLINRSLTLAGVELSAVSSIRLFGGSIEIVVFLGGKRGRYLVLSRVLITVGF